MDIVERLQGEQRIQQDEYGRGLEVLDDAADEIARLRDENESLRGSLEEWRLDLNSLRDENAKLRAAYRKMCNAAAGYSNYCEDSASVRRCEREYEEAEAMYRAIK